MKAIVKEVFIDRFTGKQHEIGEKIMIDDKSRIDDLVKRNLVKVIEEPVAEPVEKPKTRKKKAE